MPIKALHHICIQTNHYQESREFYTTALGFEVVKETQNFHSRDYNSWLRLGELFIELQTPKRGLGLAEWSSSNSGLVHLCFLVEDIQKEYEKFKSKGYRFKVKDGEEIYKVEGGYLFKVKAPEGTEIEIRDTSDL